MRHDFASYESSDGMFRYTSVSNNHESSGIRTNVQPILTADILLARVRSKRIAQIGIELRRGRHLPSMSTNQFAGWLSTRTPGEVLHQVRG